MSEYRFAYDLPQNEVAFEYDARAYHREAVYGTALVFTTQCYTFLEGGARGRARVVLQPKQPCDEQGLSRLAGEFHNELLNQTLRWMVAKHNKKTKDAIIAQALFAARSPSKKTLVVHKRRRKHS